MRTTSTPAGIGTRTWTRFSHGRPATVPVLLLEVGDVIWAGPGLGGDRRVTEISHITGGDHRTREIAFALAPLPAGPDTPLDNHVAFSADVRVLAVRPVSRSSRVWGLLVEAVLRLRSATGATVAA